MRITKWTAIILGGLVLLLIATAFVLTSVVDPNRYRAKIERIVGDLAGRPFVIEGDLAITWYPWLGVRTGDARLENPPDVAGPPLVEWQSIEVAAKVWPLLRGDIEADRIRLQSPHIHLRRDAQGRGNWEGIGTHPSGTGTVAPTAGGGRPLQIAGVEILDGTVNYVDEGSGLQATLGSLDLDVGEWRAGQALPVHMRFLAHTQSLPAAGVWVQLDAAKLTVRPTPLAVSTPKLTLQVANAQLTGDLAFEQDARTADDGMRIRAHGSAKLSTPSLRKLATDLALNQTLPHDPTTLGPLELTATWGYDNGAITAKPLALTLDQVNFNGWLQRTAPPKALWGFELHGDRIDLGRYVNIDSQNKKPFELPVDTLHAINANGHVIFDQVVLADTHMADVRLEFQTPEGKP